YGYPRVPRVDEQVGAEPLHEQQDDETGEHRERDTAAPAAQDERARDRSRVEDRDAEQHARASEQPSERREHPEQRRPRMAPPESRVDTDERGVPASDVADAQNLERDVGHRMPRHARDGRDRRRERQESDSDDQEEQGRAVTLVRGSQ